MWRPSMMVAILVFLIVGTRARKALNGLCIQILIAFDSWHILDCCKMVMRQLKIAFKDVPLKC